MQLNKLLLDFVYFPVSIGLSLSYSKAFAISYHTTKEKPSLYDFKIQQHFFFMLTPVLGVSPFGCIMLCP